MPHNRREFIGLAVGSIALSSFPPAPVFAETAKFRALLFDAFPIFDPRPVFALAEELFPGKGNDFSNTWRTRQFEYTWLRSVSGKYEDFWRVTEDSLVFAADVQKLELTSEKRDRLMQAYLELKAWPDVLPTLKTLKVAGIQMAFLSNFTPKMLEAGIRNSQLENYFDHILSTDQVRVYKPNPDAYELGIEAFRLPREEMLFVAFAGWDAVGAKWFGYPTFWANRLHAPKERLGVDPDASGEGLNDLLGFLGLSPKS